MKAHPLVVKDESLYKQIHDSRTNCWKHKRGGYHTLVGLFGRFVEDTWTNSIQEAIDGTLFSKDRWQGELGSLGTRFFLLFLHVLTCMYV